MVPIHPLGAVELSGFVLGSVRYSRCIFSVPCSKLLCVEEVLPNSCEQSYEAHAPGGSCSHIVVPLLLHYFSHFDQFV